MTTTTFGRDGSSAGAAKNAWYHAGPAGRAVTLDGVEAHLAISSCRSCAKRDVSPKRTTARLSRSWLRSDEVAGAGETSASFLCMLPLACQRETNQHRLNRLLERVDDLWYTVLHHLEIIGTEHSPTRRQAR